MWTVGLVAFGLLLPTGRQFTSQAFTGRLRPKDACFVQTGIFNPVIKSSRFATDLQRRSSFRHTTA